MTGLSRRTVVIGGLAAVSGLAVSGLVAPPPTARAAPPVHQRLAALEDANDRLIGLYAADLASGRSIAHREHESFAMCSTFKTYLAGAVLQRVQQGELRLEEPVFVPPAAIVTHSPHSAPAAGGQLTLAELCAAVLQVSDNGAANVLLQTLGGPQAITAFARSIGDDRSRLDRWETELNSAIPGDPRDTSTARALGDGYRTLLEGDALAPPQRARLSEWMRTNETSSMRAGLPPGWISADKTGSGDYGTTNDVGVLYGPQGQRIVLAVLTRSRSDDPDADNLRPLMGEVTALVLPELLR
ncbi:class A beta-lactamase [Mycolicibacterium thermoresistibile]